MLQNNILRLYIPGIIIRFFTRGHDRTIRAKRNIFASFFLSGGSVLLNMAIVPLTLNYLNPVNYGVWLTLSSLIGWFVFFDVGLGNGLRNKFAEAIAKNNREQAKIYVSTTYAIIAFIGVVLFLIGYFVNPFLDWAKILNSPPEMASELSAVFLFVLGFFCLKFVLQLISIILTADQKPALSNVIKLAGNILAVSIIYVLTKTTDGSLLYLGITVGICPVIALAIASGFFFLKDYREFMPSAKYIRLEYARDLTSLGFKFFVIQVSAIILFSTDNMIIAQLFGPEEVTPYNIAYKYFGVIIMLFNIILAPFWSAYTEAYHKNDIGWINKITRKLINTWVIVVGIAVLMLLLANSVYKIWIGREITVPLGLTISMAIYVIIFCWNYIFVSFINGVGTIRLQLYHSILVSFLNIPLSIFFAKYCNLGVTGIILATCLCILLGAIWTPIQYLKIINNSAAGVWAK